MLLMKVVKRGEFLKFVIIRHFIEGQFIYKNSKIFLENCSTFILNLTSIWNEDEMSYKLSETIIIFLYWCVCNFSPNVVYQFSQPLNEQEMEEQRRQAEGVDALLNLAGYNTSTTLLLKRPASVEPTKQFEKKQYFYTTEIAPSCKANEFFTEEPSSKKPKSRMRNKLKKKSWYR